jgi:ATP-dependent helicase HrpA
VAHLPRYLTALDRRLVKWPADPARDARHSAMIEKWWERYLERRGAKLPTAEAEAALEKFRWSLEELSVSLFAQELKTPFPVSWKRLERAWVDIGR